MNLDIRLLDRTGQLLGELTDLELDMPWREYRFAPTPAFAAIAPLFQEELRLVEGDRMEEWVDAYGRIEALGLRLEGADSAVIREFILHVQGDRARVRF